MTKNYRFLFKLSTTEMLGQGIGKAACATCMDSDSTGMERARFMVDKRRDE